MLKLLQSVLYRYLKIPPQHVNKFTIVGVVFLIWVGFIDTHSFLGFLSIETNHRKIGERKGGVEKKYRDCKSRQKGFGEQQGKVCA